MSQAKPIPSAPPRGTPLFDMSQAKSIEAAPPEKSWWQKTKEFEAAHKNDALPGSTEGAGLAGGLADWDKASFGEIGGGVKDILSGNVAKGLHRIMTGGGSMLAPAAPFAVAAAPVTAVASVAGGAAGGSLAGKGATALGATPDQAALASDVGNLAGGVGGGAATRAAGAAVRPAAQAVSKAASAIGESLDPDLVGLVSPRLAHALRMASKVGKVFGAASAEDVLDATVENKPYAGEKTPPPTAPAPKPPTLPDELAAARRAAAPVPPPVSKQLQQMLNFRPSIERIIDDAVPPKGETYRDNLIAKAAVDAHLEQGNVEAAQQVLDHVKEAPKAEPAPETEEPLNNPYKNHTPEQWKQFDERLGNILEKVKNQPPKQEAAPSVPTEEDLTPQLLESLRMIQAKKAFVDQNATQ